MQGVVLIFEKDRESARLFRSLWSEGEFVCMCIHII